MTGKNNKYFIEGDRIYLREVSPSDVNERYHSWMNDPDVTQYLESRFYPNSIEEIHQFVVNKLSDRENLFLAIILKEDNRHIGNLKLGPINWIHRFAALGIIIGEKDCWSKGYATEAIVLARRYAFETLNMHKITAGCYSPNQASLRAFEKAGFQVEGIQKEHFFCNGKFVDGILLGATAKGDNR